MRKLTTYLSILLTSFMVLNAQVLRMDVAYKYMYSKQWDRAIQTYNFSRPHLNEKQPLLIHGIQASGTYLFQSEKQLNHGITLSYSYIRSHAANPNLTNTLNLHLLDLGYVMHYSYKNKFEHFYTDLIISVSSSALYRRVNGEPYLVDGKKQKALGIGGSLVIKDGYEFSMTNKHILTPYFAIGYTPYIYAPKTESVLNQTTGLVSKNWTGILSFQIGIGFNFN